MGLTQTELAHKMGYQLRAWQFKEDRNKPRRLMAGEFEYLLLLAGEHPEFILTPR
ncbi:TPA: XRE family transcriptional regulator [Escherichia coli]|nr:MULTISPECIES: XRE family transcriptional regulator [Enterobacteriaceae]EHR3281977.1 XRE family transcriptional regulator [Salmonella enterica subsp. enterica serovar Derby]EIB3051011.1 XRE family transcriptional regulator [Salmonella enterica]HBJ7628259.1 XRE family transcriptional regulator [Salmonella enterica subsp. enterica serovar Typhimurium]HBN2973073.1 XRE family transcriptional regulator [Escherichia coli O25b:H4-ST131]HCL0536569.1 XRE family transcriptional regulator [Salmonella e